MIKSIFSVKQILIVSFAFIIGLAMFQSVYASTNAFDDGYQAARSDFLDGYEKNSYCDPDNSDPNPDAYCTPKNYLKISKHEKVHSIAIS